MTGLVEIARHLDGENPARCDERQEPRDEMLVVAEPLQRGIRVDDVVGHTGSPGRDVSLDETSSDSARARVLKHLGRVVDAVDLRLQPSGTQERRRVARTAAEVDDAVRRIERNPGEKIGGRPRPFGAEGEIGRRIPSHHMPRVRFPEFLIKIKTIKSAGIALSLHLQFAN
jgi:hypothetical protein